MTAAFRVTSVDGDHWKGEINPDLVQQGLAVSLIYKQFHTNRSHPGHPKLQGRYSPPILEGRSPGHHSQLAVHGELHGN